MSNGENSCFTDLEEISNLALRKAIEEKNDRDVFIIQTLKRITKICPEHSKRISVLETFKTRALVLWGILIMMGTTIVNKLWK